MIQVVSKKTIGILRGGSGNHYFSSLKKGGSIISSIFNNLSDKYKVVDILIDKDHVWHMGGLPISPSDLVHKVDLVWNVSHPSFSNILESFSLKNISLPSFSFAFQNNREDFKRHINELGVHIPRSIVFPFYQKDFDGDKEKYILKKAKEVHAKFCAPWIVKSFTPDSNMGIHLAKTFPELVDAITDGVNHDKSILVEEFIEGKIASFHSLKNFRGNDVYIFPTKNTFGRFEEAEKNKLSNLAKKMHSHFGANLYLKTDLLLGRNSKIYLLQLESVPDFSEQSHFEEVIRSVGSEPHFVLEHIIEEGFK